MELITIRPVGGCAQARGIFDLLFLDDLDILPVRLVTMCKDKLTEACAYEKCQRYCLGIVGSAKISWRNEGARL